jgi:hypothetical protein
MRIRDIFDPRSGIEKFESGMEKIESGMEKFESGIRYKHPGSATLSRPMFFILFYDKEKSF